MATGRIGVTPTLRTRWSKAPAGGTTSLSGLDDNSVSLVYDVGYEGVYRNGVLLSRGNDYTATDGTTVTLIDATITGDIIEIFANELIPLSDAISKGQYTAKGALLSATAASTPGVLTVGSNNQVLTADSSTATGLKWATPAAGGKVLQVVSAVTSTDVTITSTSQTDTGITATITPTASNSKVLVIISANAIVSATGTCEVGARVMRDATSIHTYGDYAFHRMGIPSGNPENLVNHSVTYLDSPATTSATTYKLQAKVRTSGTVQFQFLSTAPSTITLLEIGA